MNCIRVVFLFVSLVVVQFSFGQKKKSPKLSKVGGKNLHIGLVGNPNSGKSSLFNCLTGLNQQVGNFPVLGLPTNPICRFFPPTLTHKCKS